MTKLTKEERLLSEGSETVKRANKRSQKSAKQLGVALKSAVGFPDAICLANELEEDVRAQLWQLLECNMRDLYVNSSMGWNPLEKQHEFFHPLARFVLVSPVNNPDEIVGFSTFRFEHEAEEDILYCYELQISPLHQRTGLGRFLMNALRVIGRRMKMEKIMLTVLDKNIAANRFYSRIGFQLDECSPTYKDPEDESDDSTEVVDVDYQILSKLVS
ncbi:acyl-CoA N-acyltransferase [Lentinula raphanica]|nr:acyl-CoA N-acyltransferase [Lentinula raphanica]